MELDLKTAIINLNLLKDIVLKSLDMVSRVMKDIEETLMELLEMKI